MNDDPEAPVETDEYFGGCPQCGRNDGYLNVHQTHWFVCDEHKTKWCAGFNSFSSWHDEDECCWETNAQRLAEYSEIEPIRQRRGESMMESTISRSELGARLRDLAQAVDPRTPLFGDYEPEAPKKTPLFQDRWQAIEDMAYAIDAEPEKEAAWLWATREYFGGCDAKTDWPGYVVCHLLESLLANRGHKLRRHCPAVVPTAGVSGPSNGGVEPIA